MSATEIIAAFERGELVADTPTRILENAPPKPLHKYIRELVWAEYHSSASGPEDPEGNQALMYQAAFDYAPVAMVVTDLAGIIVDCNDALTQMLGYTREEFIGMRVGQVSADEDRAAEIAQGNELFAGRRRFFQMERRYRHKDGSIVPALLSVAMARDTEGVPNRVIGQFANLTEQKAMEAELSRSERLKTVGRLAGGVAHDFNNLLTVIEAEIDSLERGNTEERGESLANVREATSISARLTQQLMAFSREGAVTVETLDLNRLVASIRPILKAALTGRCRLHLYMEPEEILPIKVNSILIEQVLMNLVFNARNAMEDPSGLISIRTRREEDDKIVFEVEDTGKGMSEEVLSRAFEPFYTTRQGSGGTGLGLATVYGIVTRFHGDIALESEEGKGTICRVTLPAGEASEVAPSPRDTKVGRKQVDSSPGTENDDVRKRILLVDDQATIVRILDRVFRKNGYQVATAGSVADGIQAILGATKPFDLLLSDLQLPDGHGTAVANAARERWSELPVIFMSGYTGNSVSQDEIMGGQVEFVAKPFIPKELLARIERLVN